MFLTRRLVTRFFSTEPPRYIPKVYSERGGRKASKCNKRYYNFFLGKRKNSKNVRKKGTTW